MISCLVTILIISDQFVVYACITMIIMGLIGNGLNMMILAGLKLFCGNQSVFYIVVVSIDDCATLLIKCIIHIRRIS